MIQITIAVSASPVRYLLMLTRFSFDSSQIDPILGTNPAKSCLLFTVKNINKFASESDFSAKSASWVNSGLQAFEYLHRHFPLNTLKLFNIYVGLHFSIFSDIRYRQDLLGYRLFHSKAPQFWPTICFTWVSVIWSFVLNEASEYCSATSAIIDDILVNARSPNLSRKASS